MGNKNNKSFFSAQELKEQTEEWWKSLKGSYIRITTTDGRLLRGKFEELVPNRADDPKGQEDIFLSSTNLYTSPTIRTPPDFRVFFTTCGILPAGTNEWGGHEMPPPPPASGAPSPAEIMCEVDGVEVAMRKGEYLSEVMVFRKLIVGVEVEGDE